MKCLLEGITYVSVQILSFTFIFLLILFRHVQTALCSLFCFSMYCKFQLCREGPLHSVLHPLKTFFKHEALWAAELMIPGFQQVCVSWLGSLTSNKVWLPIKAFPVADTVLAALSHVDSQRSNRGELIVLSLLQWRNAGTHSSLPDFIFSEPVTGIYFLTSAKFQRKWPQISNVTADTQKDVQTRIEFLWECRLWRSLKLFISETISICIKGFTSEKWFCLNCCFLKIIGRRKEPFCESGLARTMLVACHYTQQSILH